ncbi:hypothetical protein ACVWZV_002235 [Bradyrhizobium sp. GM5.1]
MDQLKFILNVALFAAIVTFIWVETHRRPTFIDTPIPAKAEEVTTPPAARHWRCHMLVTCEDSDWRYTKPEDVCTYTQPVELWDAENPADSTEAYGSHCDELDVKG